MQRCTVALTEYFGCAEAGIYLFEMVEHGHFYGLGIIRIGLGSHDRLPRKVVEKGVYLVFNVFMSAVVHPYVRCLFLLDACLQPEYCALNRRILHALLRFL